jgi:hypothetical protein
MAQTITLPYTGVPTIPSSWNAWMGYVGSGEQGPIANPPWILGGETFTVSEGYLFSVTPGVDSLMLFQPFANAPSGKGASIKSTIQFFTSGIISSPYGVGTTPETFLYTSGAYWGFLLRAIDQNNWWRARIILLEPTVTWGFGAYFIGFHTVLQLERCTDGVLTILATQDLGVTAIGWTLEALFVGDVFSATVLGLDLSGNALASGVLTVTDDTKPKGFFGGISCMNGSSGFGEPSSSDCAVLYSEQYQMRFCQVGGQHPVHICVGNVA